MLLLVSYEMACCYESKSNALFKGKSIRTRWDLPYHLVSSWVDMDEIKVHKIMEIVTTVNFKLENFLHVCGMHPWNNS